MAKIGNDTLGEFDSFETGIVGNKSGSQSPFPIQLSGTAIAGTGLSQQGRGIPIANLASAPNDILHQLQLGAYIGWAV